MEPQTPLHHGDATVGRVEVPHIVFNPTHHQSLLAGTLSGSRVAPANSARRRLYGPTLLGSPARRGHSPRMADIFGDAKNNLASKSVPAMKPAAPFPTLRQLPLRPKPASILTDSAHYVAPGQTPSPPETEGVPLYPQIPSSELDPPPKAGPAHSNQTIRGVENSLQTYREGRFYAQFQQPPLDRVSPPPYPEGQSYFEHKPTINHAQIVPMSAIDTGNLPNDDLSSSSASWTGDSQFYMPQQRAMVLPAAQDRKSSVPEWLDELPAAPEEFEAADEGEEDEEMVAPLTPDVEIERGSMRRKLRGSPEKKRRRSMDEDEYHPI